MEDLWRLSTTDVAAAIKSKKVSARQVAEAALARVGPVNPALNAVVDHRPEDVLAQAAEVDAAIARNEAIGPLAGVPVTVKVNIDQAGYANTNGLNLQKANIATENSPVIDNLRKSGAVILGRTNCPAFSYRWFTTNLIHGDTKNPRDPSITPGGSSGGAGAGGACLRSIRACPSAASARRSRRCPVRSHAPSRTSALRSPRCRRAIRATRGGCRRHWKALICRSAPRSVSIPIASIPCLK